MRVRSGILVGLVALTACGSSSGMAASAGCGPATARTLAADRVARVYQTAVNVYGCSSASRTSYLLGASGRSIREGRARPIDLAGFDVAYGHSDFGVDTVSAQVVVRSLRTGRQLRSEPATTRPLGAESFQSVASVVAKPDGAVAWIGEGGSVISGASSDVEVDRADAHGLAPLDSGSGIDTRSLRLRGSTVSWRHNARARSAALL